MHNNSPSKGKWSVGSHIFHNSQTIVVDRVKQILLKESHDTEKVRQIKMLLGMPTEEEQIIKIEEEDDRAIVYGGIGRQEERQKQGKLQPLTLMKAVQEDDGKESVSKFFGKKMKKPFKI